MGVRRVGLAKSDPSGVLATPLRTLRVSGPLASVVQAVVDEIDRLGVEDDGVAGVVVGVPRSLDGQPHEQTTRTLAFVESLRSRVSVPVHLQDERLTSREAESKLALVEKDWRRRKGRLDAAAAAVLLQDFLDQQRPHLQADWSDSP